MPLVRLVPSPARVNVPAPVKVTGALLSKAPLTVTLPASSMLVAVLIVGSGPLTSIVLPEASTMLMVLPGVRLACWIAQLSVLGVTPVPSSVDWVTA